MLELKYCEYILRIAATMNVSKAAEELYISQPALSRILNSVEKSLGFPLFDRSRHPMQMTPEGMIYISYLRRVKEQEKEMKEQISILGSGRRVSMRIGLVPEHAFRIYSEILPEIQKEQPELEFLVTNGYSGNLENAYRRNELDICILNGPLEKECGSSLVLEQEEVLAVTGNRNPVLRKLVRGKNEKYGSISSAELAGRNFVLLNPEQRMYRIASDILAEHRIRPEQTPNVFNMTTASQLAATGCITFLPESFLESSGSGKGLTAFRIEGQIHTWQLMLLYKEETCGKLARDIAERYKAGSSSEGDRE